LGICSLRFWDEGNRDFLIAVGMMLGKNRATMGVPCSDERAGRIQKFSLE